MAKVLLLDEELSLVQMLGELLRSEGHQVLPFTNSQAAVDALHTAAPELVIANFAIEKTRISGVRILQMARCLNSPALVMVITSSGSMDTAIDAMRRGAYDYLNRPFSLDELKLRIQRALTYQAALAENMALRKQLQSKTHFQDIIAGSAPMQKVLRLLESTADSEAAILISGQEGTGKELVARTIHANSRRRFGPFLPVNCCLPEALLETELFGQRKTGFFGATADEIPGLFREASGGTLFLQDVDGLSIELQARLDQFLRENRVPPENDNASSLDVRLLAASNQPLPSAVATGAFHQGLFQRLNEVCVLLPPLCERAEDIPLLVTRFLEGKAQPGTGKPYLVTRTAIEACCRYPWPGNVRELEQALEHACALCQNSTIEPSDLPRAVQQIAPTPQAVATDQSQNGRAAFHTRTEGAGPLSQPPHPSLDSTTATSQGVVPLKQFLRDQEISHLQRILAQTGGCKERAAEILGISLATLYRKLSEPDETPPRSSAPEPIPVNLAAQSSGF